MTRIAVKKNTECKESKAFPYEMTELVSDEEKELQESLRRDVRKIELEIKRCMLWQRFKGASVGN